LRLPDFEPMLAVSERAAFDDEGWWFEVKWDGYRAIVGSERGTVRARSRRGLDLIGPFPELAGLDIPDGVVIDGELTAFDGEGRPSFSLLQRRTGFGGAGTGAPVAVSLVAFDVLFRGEDLTSRPYEERRRVLDGLGLGPPIIVPEPTPTHGRGLFEAVKGQGMEGVVGKRLGSAYQPGRRSSDWRKISIRRRLRAVIGGYLAGEGGRSQTFGSVLAGLYEPAGLRWVGAVGSGFDESALRAVHAALSQLERPSSPFINEVKAAGRPTWVEPGIVINVEYREWTPDDRLRAPVYRGVEQADPETVTWAAEGPG